jgi:3-dehydroquinate synthase
VSAGSVAPTRLNVVLGQRSYDVVVGTGLLAQAGALMQGVLARPRLVVVADARVAPLHLADLTHGLEAAGIRHELVPVPPGEASKSFAELERLIDRLLELEVERYDTVAAFGGGVVGDLAGLAASLLKRGVPYVQIPTTLLAQVDSSVGGKTAIDSPRGKNLIGAFHQPRLVLADVGTLATLPRRELLAGYAEVVKYGLLGDRRFFEWLEAQAPALIGGDPSLLSEAVLASCRAKARIVAADERESGERALLNLGHTFGHALEAEAGYGERLLHGEAVAIGMVMAFELSARLGYCPLQDAVRVRRHLAAVGLPTGVRDAGLGRFDSAGLLTHMRQDKKVRDGRLTFVLVRGIGEAFVTRDVSVASVVAMLDRELAA